MKKIISIFIFLIILFVFPLAWNIKLIFRPTVIISIIIITLLMITQPPMDFKEISENKSTDRGTIMLIITVSIIGHIVSLIDWMYFVKNKDVFNNITLVAITLMIFGISLRIWAIQTLKTAFSPVVQIKNKQALIKSGPYNKIRHPSYTGAWLLFIGNSLLFKSVLGFVILGIIMFFVYLKRIKVEESVLIEAYKEEYLNYMKTTWKLIPGF